VSAPLEGVRVLDFSRVLAGPLCTMLLERFARNAERVRHRDELTAILAELFRQEPANVWMERLNAAEIPCGPT
jgi:crotonobetainyl-CoA:carnitine CoA-transferase CaiB-like acyl-CoA transferase